MNSAIERLLSLRVRDIMQQAVVCVSESEPLQVAADRITNAEVTGVPVVDELGRCVGVLSATDFMESTVRRDGANGAIEAGDGRARSNQDRSESLVADVMSREVLSIGPDATVVQAARKLCKYHIHRLIVLSEDRQPVGIVSSLDLVATLVAAVEE